MEATTQLYHHDTYAAVYVADSACTLQPTLLAVPTTGAAPTRRGEPCRLKIHTSQKIHVDQARKSRDKISVDHSAIMLCVVCYLIPHCWGHLLGPSSHVRAPLHYKGEGIRDTNSRHNLFQVSGKQYNSQ